MQLGRHFEIAEFTRNSHGLRVYPNTPALVSLVWLVALVLDPLREALGSPVRITSGYRTEELNKLIGGARASQHVLGEAADIKVHGMTGEALAAAIIHLGIPFDQLIWYAPARGGHVHISFTIRRENRGQVLEAPASGGYRAWQAPAMH